MKQQLHIELRIKPVSVQPLQCHFNLMVLCWFLFRLLTCETGLSLICSISVCVCVSV